MEDKAHLEELAAEIKTQIKQTLLISARVELLPPKSIPRSEGKAKRITDNRNTGF
jgi:phenylacetate-CoA ligase